MNHAIATAIMAEAAPGDKHYMGEEIADGLRRKLHLNINRSRDSVPHPQEAAAVCDASTGTTEDAVASRVLPYLPYYLSSLTHFTVILGAAVLQWMSDSRSTQSGSAKRTFGDLLSILHGSYTDEEEMTIVRAGVKTTYCLKCSKTMSKCQCAVSRSKTCQTDEDAAWTEHVKQIVDDSEHFIRSLGSNTADSQSRSSSSSSHSSGPEEYTAEDRNLGATALPPNQPSSASTSQHQTNPPQTTAVSRDPIPEHRQTPSPDTEDDAVGTQGAAAEELRQLVDEDKCKVCLENEMDIVLLPCGHFVMCSDCAARVSRCPTCREVIQATLRAYRP